MSSRFPGHALVFAVVASLQLAALVAAQEDLPIPRVSGQKTATGVEVLINQIDASEFPRVVIFATVLKDGAPVPGLADKDFRVREDEVDQEPLTVVPKLTPLSMVLTLDTSGSMKKRLTDAQAAAKSFLDTLETEDKVQVIRFSRDVKTIYPLGTDRSEAKAAIDGTVARGDTALWDALYVSVESLREVIGRKAIVLLSDGVDDDGTGKPLSTRIASDVLALAREVNVPIYAIGLGTELDEVNLRKVASESGALYLNAVEPAELERLYDSIGKQLAGQYTIYYSSNLPADGTEHLVQMKFADGTSTKAYRSPIKVTAEAAPVETKAAPVEKVKRLARPQRAVNVSKPAIDLPPMEKILVVSAGAGDNPHAYLPPDTAGSGTSYGEPIRLAPNAKAEKFDVIWVPKKGKRIAMVRDIAFDEEHSTHEIKPDEHIGVVRLEGKDLPKPSAVYIADAGDNPMTVRLMAVQNAKGYGENMPVPAGTYDLYIESADTEKLELVAEKLDVKAGRVTEVE